MPCDAVVVCTPPAIHVDVALDLVAHGIAVLCEKPLTLDLPSAVKLVGAADDAGVLLTMAAKFRYVDDVIRAQEIVESGSLGELIVVRERLRVPGPDGRTVELRSGHQRRRRPHRQRHALRRLVRYFLGSVSEVMAVESKRVQAVAVEDTAQMLIRTAVGTRGTIDLSWSIDKEVDSFASIYGSEGTIHVGWRESKYRSVSSPEWVRFGSGYDKLACMRAQVANFCGALLGREELLITPEDAVASVAVIEAAYESLEQGRWIPVDAA